MSVVAVATVRTKPYSCLTIAVLDWAAIRELATGRGVPEDQDRTRYLAKLEKALGKGDMPHCVYLIYQPAPLGQHLDDLRSQAYPGSKPYTKVFRRDVPPSDTGIIVFPQAFVHLGPPRRVHDLEGGRLPPPPATTREVHRFALRYLEPSQAGDRRLLNRIWCLNLNFECFAWQHRKPFLSSLYARFS